MKKCLRCGGADRTFASSCPIRKEAFQISQEKEREREKEREARPLKAVAQKAAQATIQAVTNTWKPLINQVCQGIGDDAIPKTESTVHLALPDNLSKEVMMILLKGNNLPALGQGEADIRGILRVVQSPSSPPAKKPSENASHVQALDTQIEQISKTPLHRLQTQLPTP